MGEINKVMADNFRNVEINNVKNMKKQIRENFEEMDFANADKRDEMEKTIVEMEEYCDKLISGLSTLVFY